MGFPSRLRPSINAVCRQLFALAHTISQEIGEQQMMREFKYTMGTAYQNNKWHGVKRASSSIKMLKSISQRAITCSYSIFYSKYDRQWSTNITILPITSSAKS